MSFREGFRKVLEMHEVDYNERDVWDSRRLLAPIQGAGDLPWSIPGLRFAYPGLCSLGLSGLGEGRCPSFPIDLPPVAA